MANKTYTVFIITKANRTEYLHAVCLEAPDAKTAKAEACRRIEETTGRCAFRPSNGKPDKATRELLDMRGTHESEYLHRAYEGGYDLYPAR